MGAADVAETTFMMDQPAAARRPGKIHEPDRLARGAAARPGNPGDRHGKIDRGMGDGAPGHGLGGFAAHRADTFDRRQGDAKHGLLGGIAVSHEAAIEHIGRTGNFGQGGGEEPTRARFRRGDPELPAST